MADDQMLGDEVSAPQPMTRKGFRRHHKGFLQNVFFPLKTSHTYRVLVTVLVRTLDDPPGDSVVCLGCVPGIIKDHWLGIYSRARVLAKCQAQTLLSSFSQLLFHASDGGARADRRRWTCL
ncbi:hypothetical protein GQ53DRAFT_238133 [Thozetella sp. PMI_491]|nr:hypothetical protein GQ53DRAFT_238133 [Thozetella sp. PMI_491]